MRRPLHLALTLALAGACGGSREAVIDGDAGADAGVDAPWGSLEDGGPDGAAPPDADVADADTDPDAEVHDGATPDAPPDAPDASDLTCEACTPAHECEEAACVAGVCRRAPAPDGTTCGELVAPSVCVAGACVARGCGDGYVEPGPTPDDPDAPPREACDDGNLLDGDACSSSCTSTPIVVDVDPEGEWGPALEPSQPRALGVDGEGRVLLIYQRAEAAGAGALLGQRFGPAGVREGDAFEIGVPFVYASVAGLAGGGWVVAYDRVVGAPMATAVFRVITADGAVGPERRAGTIAQEERDARVSTVGDGFVVTFQRETRLEQRLFARRFTATGAPLGPELLVHAGPQVRSGSVAAEGEGDDLRWLVVWQTDFLGPRPRVEGRRYRADVPLDAGPVVLADGMIWPLVAPARVPGVRDEPDVEPSAERVRFLLVYEREGTIGLQPVTMGPPAGFPPAIAFPRASPVGRDTSATVAPRRARDAAGVAPALVGFVSGSGTVGVGPALTATVSLPADDVMRLTDTFDAGLAEGPLALAASPRGTWIAWAESGPGFPLHLFLLPD
ncbi:MAG: hypothetical protein KF901_11830 [Myxococcales bacterium]|nr:hypothetical protein [Myxococcales bacterium]